MKLGTPGIQSFIVITEERVEKKVEIVKVEKERQSRGLKKTTRQGSDTLAPSQVSKKVEENEVSHPKLYYKEELSKRENQNYYINIQKNKK